MPGGVWYFIDLWKVRRIIPFFKGVVVRISQT